MVSLRTNGDFNIDNGFNNRLENLLDKGYNEFVETVSSVPIRYDYEMGRAILLDILKG